MHLCVEVEAEAGVDVKKGWEILMRGTCCQLYIVAESLMTHSSNV